MEASFVSPPVSGRGRPAVLLALDTLRRPGGRRAVSTLALVFLLAGVGLLAYPLGTNVWQHFVQDSKRSAFAGDPRVAEEYGRHAIGVGDGLTELRVPRIGLDVLVVEGTTASALRAGAGHYAGTPLPGEPGNVGIAGHRTTFGRPFARLNELSPGDEATLTTPFGIYTYRMVPAADFGGGNPLVVAPDAVSVLEQDPTRRYLTLTTCHPKGSADKRLVARLALVGAVARPGRALPADTVPPPASPARRGP